MLLSRFVGLCLLNLPRADKDDTAESRKYHPSGAALSRFPAAKVKKRARKWYNVRISAASWIGCFFFVVVRAGRPAGCRPSSIPETVHASWPPCLPCAVYHQTLRARRSTTRARAGNGVHWLRFAGAGGAYGLALPLADVFPCSVFSAMSYGSHQNVRRIRRTSQPRLPMRSY